MTPILNNVEADVSGQKSDGPQCVSEKFLEHAQFPRNLGLLRPCNGRANVVGSCGDSMEVTLRVDEDRVNDLRAQPKGCSFTVACASAMTMLARGRSLDHCLSIGPQDVAGMLGGLPDDHLHCARMAVNALHEAISDHYRRNLAARDAS